MRPERHESCSNGRMPSRQNAPHASAVAPIPTSGLIFVGISLLLGFAYAVACLGG